MQVLCGQQLDEQANRLSDMLPGRTRRRCAWKRELGPRSAGVDFHALDERMLARRRELGRDFALLDREDGADAADADGLEMFLMTEDRNRRRAAIEFRRCVEDRREPRHEPAIEAAQQVALVIRRRAGLLNLHVLAVDLNPDYFLHVLQGRFVDANEPALEIARVLRLVDVEDVGERFAVHEPVLKKVHVLEARRASEGWSSLLACASGFTVEQLVTEVIQVRS